MTRNDIMNNDADLMITAAELLGRGTPRRFDVALSEAGGELTATFEVLESTGPTSSWTADPASPSTWATIRAQCRSLALGSRR